MTLWELLGGVTLTGLTQQTPTGVPVSIPEGFLKPTRKNDGPTIVYFVEKGSVKQAQLIHYDAPPIPADKEATAMKTASILHTSHYHDYSVTDYQNMLAPEGSAQRDMAEWEIQRHTKNLKIRFSNLRIAATTFVLAKGTIWANSAGHLLASAGGAFFTIDFQVPATHKNQLDGKIAAKWSAADTDIPLHVQDVMDHALIESGLPLTTAIYGKNIFKYLYSNNFVGKILASDSGLANSFRNNQIPAGFLGLKNWVRAPNSLFKLAAGTWSQIIGDNDVIFMPDPDSTWWDFIEGSYIVPTDLATVSAEAADQLSNIEKVYGFYSYAKLRDEPITVRQIMGDSFMPMLLNNLALYQAVVHW